MTKRLCFIVKAEVKIREHPGFAIAIAPLEEEAKNSATETLKEFYPQLPLIEFSIMKTILCSLNAAELLAYRICSLQKNATYDCCGYTTKNYDLFLSDKYPSVK